MVLQHPPGRQQSLRRDGGISGPNTGINTASASITNVNNWELGGAPTTGRTPYASGKILMVAYYQAASGWLSDDESVWLAAATARHALLP